MGDWRAFDDILGVKSFPVCLSIFTNFDLFPILCHWSGLTFSLDYDCSVLCWYKFELLKNRLFIQAISKGLFETTR